MEEHLLLAHELDRLNMSETTKPSSEAARPAQSFVTNENPKEAATDTGERGEQPKSIFEKGEERLFRELFYIHTLPVLVTLALLVLYIRKVSWTPPWPTTNVLNALQFAAKIHESLILFSLSTIVYHHLKHRLISAKDVGVSLGLLSSAFQLGSAFFLVNQEFLAVLSNLRRLSSRDAVTVCVLVYVFILAMVSGPSTAIVMIPKLDWWPYTPTEKAIFTQPLEHFYAVPHSELYPTTISKSPRLENCSFETYKPGVPIFILQAFGNECPLMGYLDIAGNLNQTYLQLKEGYNSNVSIQVSPNTYQYGGPRNIMARLPLATPLLNPLAYATTPLDSVGISARLMNQNAEVFTQEVPTTTLSFRVLANDSTGTNTWKQPLVRTQCSSLWANNAYVFEYPSEETAKKVQFQVGFNDNTSPATTNTSSVMIIDTQILEISPKFTPSAAIAVTNGTVTNGTLCIISAEWVDADLTVTTPSANDLPLFTIDTPSNDITQSGPDWISIDTQWLTQLNNNWSATYMTNVTKTCASDIYCLSLAYSLGVTEALARVQHRTGDWFTMTPADSLRELKNVTNITYVVSRNVYQYGFGSITVYLAFVVLLLHTLTVFAHFCIQCRSKKGLVKAWPTLGQLLVLALQSPSPPLLENTGSGVKTTQTWRLRAAVRDLSEENRVGVVLSEDGHPVSRPDDGTKAVVHLRAGHKYA